MHIYLVRHGETEWSATDRHTSFTDISLTEKGIEQASLLKKRLAGRTFTHVFTSPRKRAQETCEIAGFQKQAEILPDISEWNYGEYEGLTTPEIQKQEPQWNIFTHGALNGESVAEASERASHVIAKLKSCKGDVLLFSHGHFLRLLAIRWVELAPAYGRNFALSAASISILGYERVFPVFQRWNDTSHLEK